MPDFDYSLPGAYFVTICAHRRERLFGEIVLDEMKLNQLGAIVNECWVQIPAHFANVQLAAHVVMPNHLHGLVSIHEVVPTRQCRPTHQHPSVGAQHAAPACGRRREIAAGSLAAIIRSFKAASTRRARDVLQEPEFVLWQRNFYDTVLRNAKEFRNAQRYIIENPLKWYADRENPEFERAL
ncbi:MAG TPA: transposase [Candidatus Acidoferrales bacterium]|nr:transposase [Candidatus Acidoferrales bacterium]